MRSEENDWREKAAAFALSVIYSLEPRVPKAIVENLGSAAAIFDMDRDSLETVLGPFNKHKDKIRSRKLEQWADRLTGTMPPGWNYLAYCEDAFPQRLWICEDSPLGLYFRGESSPAEVFGRPGVSIVGTRDMSSYGAQWCRKLVSALAATEQKPTIVSGLAFGVDISAQNAAIEAGLPTLAVLPSGAGCIYPRQHEYYASRIAGSPLCALVTEYPPDCSTYATSFLCRNRIIAGLGQATVLVESRIKGGGMTTAQMASSYSRDVFAVPGRCDDVRSQGCNMLIHSRIAEPIFDCDSFIKALDFKKLTIEKSLGKLSDSIEIPPGSGARPPGSGARMSASMAKLVLAIRNNRDVDATELAGITGIPIGEVLSQTVILENDGIIQSDILGRYSIKMD